MTKDAIADEIKTTSEAGEGAPKGERVESDEHLPDIDVPHGYSTWKARLTLLLLALVTGTGYLTLQQMLTGTIEDAVFVSMLIGATAILLYGLKYLRDYLVKRGIRFYNFVLSTDDPEEAYHQHNTLCSSVLNYRRMTLAGVAYGATVGSAPFLLSLWQATPVLQASLAVFLFAINFATGVAFYGLIAFFVHAVQMGEMIEVDIWRVNKPSTEFLLGATRRISILASVYAGLSNTSILFSVLPINALVIAYFCFSGLTILASVVIPSVPIAKKLRDAKWEAVNEIEHQLHNTLKASLKKAKDPDAEISTERFESLLTMKEKIEAVHSWPFRIKSIFAGLSVVFFSSIPLIVESLLQSWISG